MKRPTTTDHRTGGSSTAVTPASAELIELLGKAMHLESVALDHDQWRAIRRLYGYTTEPPRERPPAPVDPGSAASWEAKRRHEAALEAWQRWEDPRPMMQAFADRNALRYAAADGLRLLAWLARHVAPGRDPVMALVEIAIGAGVDVSPEDVEWAQGDDTDSAEVAA